MALTDKLTAIANAVRAKAGISGSLTLPQIASAITAIVTPNATATYDQRNNSAKGFINTSSYDPSDYTGSSIFTYASQTTAYAKDKGAGVTVSMPAAGTLTVYDAGGTMSYSVAAGDHTIYNITPGTTGAYFLRNSSDAIIAAGLLKPTGALRMIHPTYMGNVRDLGGWSCDGGTVKYGKLFRGCAVYNRPDDQRLLHDLLGIRAELDLRWESEIEAGMEAYNMSSYYSLIGSDVDLKHIDGAWYNNATTGILAQEANVKEMLEYVFAAVKDHRPLYFHCVTGADRTGTLALILETLLGVSQSDIDKDYELTSLYTGVDTDAHARRRNESDWTGLVSAFDSYTGSTFRDKVVSYVLSLGITIDEINAFRASMIDGTPSALVSGAGNVNVTRSLTGAIADNTANTNEKYQPYTAVITPDNGKVISAVQVTMGDRDITRTAFSGTKTIMRHSVSVSLTNCSTNSDRNKVISGESYFAILTANAGYTMEGATISITMGGISVPNYYQNGVIAIPKVTGDIVINVTAVASAPAYTNQVPISTDSIGNVYESVGYKDGYRFNSSHAETSATGYFITGFIPVAADDVIRFDGFGFVTANTDNINNGYCRVETYDSSKNSISGIAGSGFLSFSDLEPVISENYLTQFSVKTSRHLFEGAAYIRVSGYGSGANAIITVNEEIV